MPREPLYPHRPKSRQPQFPHVPPGRQSGVKMPATGKLSRNDVEVYLSLPPYKAIIWVENKETGKTIWKLEGAENINRFGWKDQTRDQLEERVLKYLEDIGVLSEAPNYLSQAKSAQTKQTRTVYYAQAWVGETLESSSPDFEVERLTLEQARRDMERWKQNPRVLAIEIYKGKQEFIEDAEAGRAGGYWQLAEFEEWEPVEHWTRPGFQAQNISPVDYWNKYLEHNPIRAPLSGKGPDTSAGAFLSWVLEAAGDILRELADDHPAMDYVIEKFLRIRKNLKDKDWSGMLSPREEKDLIEIKKLLQGMPAPDLRTTRIKLLMEAILNRQPWEVEERLKQLEPLLKTA